MIVNNQRVVDLDIRPLSLFLTQALRAVSEARNNAPDVALIDDEAMKKLNHTFRGKDSTTDVLSFQYPSEQFETTESLGDIVISIEQARRQSVENDIDLELECKQLILHGILHLCDYDHESDDGEMNRREIELRETLKIE